MRKHMARVSAFLLPIVCGCELKGEAMNDGLFLASNEVSTAMIDAISNNNMVAASRLFAYYGYYHSDERRHLFWAWKAAELGAEDGANELGKIVWESNRSVVDLLSNCTNMVFCEKEKLLDIPTMVRGMLQTGVTVEIPFLIANERREFLEFRLCCVAGRGAAWHCVAALFTDGTIADARQEIDRQGVEATTWIVVRPERKIDYKWRNLIFRRVERMFPNIRSRWMLLIDLHGERKLIREMNGVELKKSATTRATPE